MRAEHAEEMSRARAQLDAMKETENRRALNAYYKVRYRAGLFNKIANFKSSSGQIRKCLRVLLESLSQPKKIKTRYSEPLGETTIINNNNYYRQPTGPEELHPNDWREDSHLVPPPSPGTVRPLRPAMVTPNSGTSRAGPINTPNHTPLDNTCLRKPGQFHEHCRQLHVPYGEPDKEKLYNTFSNENNNYSGVREMPAEPAVNSHPYAKTLVGEIIPPKKESEPNKEDKPPKTQGHLP